VNESEAKLALFFSKQPVSVMESVNKTAYAIEETCFGILVVVKMHFDIGDTVARQTGQFVQSARLVLLLGVEKRVDGGATGAVAMPRGNMRPQPGPATHALKRGAGIGAPPPRLKVVRDGHPDARRAGTDAVPEPVGAITGQPPPGSEERFVLCRSRSCHETGFIEQSAGRSVGCHQLVLPQGLKQDQVIRIGKSHPLGRQNSYPR
jgi:hypothetical protein